jgi:hypothetical protein
MLAGLLNIPLTRRCAAVVANPGQSPGSATQYPLATIPFSTALPFGGQYTMGAQAVVGQSGSAFAFTAAVGAIVNGGCSVNLVANGLASQPIFPAGWVLNSGSWNNTVGMQNLLIVGYDGTTIFYTLLQPSSTTIPTPTTFSASPGGTTITIDIAGGSLAAITPPLSAFTLNAVRPAQAGQPVALPAPYVLSSVSVASSSVTLSITGGTFAASDIVLISYTPPFGDITMGQSSTPLQDADYDYVAGWSNAVVSI